MLTRLHVINFKINFIFLIKIFFLNGQKVNTKLKYLENGIPEKWDPRPATPRWDRDPGPHKWDPGSGTPSVGPGTWDPKIFKWNLGTGTPEVGRQSIIYYLESLNAAINLDIYYWKTKTENN